MDDITKKQIDDIIEAKLTDFERRLLGFTSWKVQDSVTDRFTPITGASSQIGFFGAQKSAQPTTSGTSSSFADSGATVVHTGSTFDGYTLAQVVKALRTLGLLA